MHSPRLTTPAYWNSTYASGDLAPLELEGYKNRASRTLIQTLERSLSDRSRVLEVGAGNSAVLTYLAKQHGERAQFSGLDYSERGCEMLALRAKSAGVTVEIIRRDLFELPPAGSTRFDLVYSIGVVEHFRDLAAVLRAKKQLLAPRGRMLTVIPNMAGAIGVLTRRYNRAVYDAHVPHTLRSFLDGHAAAALEVQSCGYLCSTNFGVLSSCFATVNDRGWSTYLWLSRLTKALWFLEDRLGAELPHSRLLSPYIFAVASSSPSKAETQ